MEIIGKCLTLQNIKGLRSMSHILKIPDLVKNSSDYSEFRRALSAFKIDDLELLLDWYRLYEDDLFEQQIKAITDELLFRRSSLGRELF
jgi:hypothetical protein